MKYSLASAVLRTQIAIAGNDTSEAFDFPAHPAHDISLSVPQNSDREIYRFIDQDIPLFIKSISIPLATRLVDSYSLYVLPILHAHNSRFMALSPLLVNEKFLYCLRDTLTGSKISSMAVQSYFMHILNHVEFSGLDYSQ